MSIHVSNMKKKYPIFIYNSYHNIYPVNNPIHCGINICSFDSINVCCICSKCICINHSVYIDKTNVIICNVCKKNPHYADIIRIAQRYYSKQNFIQFYLHKLLKMIKLEWLNKSNKINPYYGK